MEESKETTSGASTCRRHVPTVAAPTCRRHVDGAAGHMSPDKLQYRKTPRASFFDYEEGCYFITICTHDKLHYFGKITDGQMILSIIGKYLDEQINNASAFFPEIEVPLFVIMPNHLHMIIYVNSRRDMPSACGSNISAADVRNPNPYERPNTTCQRHVPTLSRYINSLKGAVTKYARSIGVEFGWQSRYHDHVIRGTLDANRIAEYIENNVTRWANDCFNK